ncbi:MAG: LysR family transcriptional regulator, partial [Spirochaetia bacterium]
MTSRRASSSVFTAGWIWAAVTRAIAALEAELGVQLFVRTTRQVSLTTDGAI